MCSAAEPDADAPADRAGRARGIQRRHHPATTYRPAHQPFAAGRIRHGGAGSGHYAGYRSGGHPGGLRGEQWRLGADLSGDHHARRLAEAPTARHPHEPRRAPLRRAGNGPSSLGARGVGRDSLVKSFNNSTVAQNSDGYYTGVATNSFTAWHCCASGRGRYEGSRSQSFQGGGLIGSSEGGPGSNDGRWSLTEQGDGFTLVFDFDDGSREAWQVTVDGNENVYVDGQRVQVKTTRSAISYSALLPQRQREIEIEYGERQAARSVLPRSILCVLPDFVANLPANEIPAHFRLRTRARGDYAAPRDAIYNPAVAGGLHVLSLQSPAAVYDIELDFLTHDQGPELPPNDGSLVDKDFLAAIGHHNKAVAAAVVEPSDASDCHGDRCKRILSQPVRQVNRKRQ